MVLCERFEAWFRSCFCSGVDRVYQLSASDVAVKWTSRVVDQSLHSIYLLLLNILDNLIGQFVGRLVTQFQQLSSFLLHAYHKYASGLRVVMETPNHVALDEDYMTRDEFNLHKIVVAVTNVGKVRGRQLWDIFSMRTPIGSVYNEWVFMNDSIWRGFYSNPCMIHAFCQILLSQEIWPVH